MEDLQFICKSNHTHPSTLEVDRCNERRAISEVVDRMQWQIVLAHKSRDEQARLWAETEQLEQAPLPPVRVPWFRLVGLVLILAYALYRLVRG